MGLRVAAEPGAEEAMAEESASAQRSSHSQALFGVPACEQVFHRCAPVAGLASLAIRQDFPPEKLLLL